MITTLAIKEEILGTSQAFIDLSAINETQTYSKTALANTWQVHRRTILRWHQTALNYCPGYVERFLKIENLGQCPHCQKEYKMSPLEYKSASRKWLIECPHCHKENVPKLRQIETKDLNAKIPGRYAQVLRIVGALNSTLGSKSTIEALTISQKPEHVHLRKFIRHLLIRREKF